MAANLDTIKSDSDWGSEATRINKNFNSINTELESLKNNTSINIPLFETLEQAKKVIINPSYGKLIFIGTDLPASAYKWDGKEWEDTGIKGGSAEVQLINYYTKEEINLQKEETDSKFSELEKDRIKKTTELNISALYSTNGEGGTNKYTLAGAIAQVPAEYRTIDGLKITFVNNETSMVETWVYNGETFTDVSQWVLSNDSKKINNAIDNINTKLGEITLSQGALSSSTGVDINTNYNERVKTTYIPKFRSIALNDGFVFTNYCIFDKDGTFLKGGLLSSSTYSEAVSNDSLYRFSIRKSDSGRIYPIDNVIKDVVYEGSYLAEEIRSSGIKDIINDCKFGLDNIPIFQGGIRSMDGYIQNVENRVYTDYLSGNISILLNNGYKFISLAEYDNDLTFISGQTDINSNLYTGSVKNGFIRFTIKKDDDGSIDTSDDIIKEINVIKDSLLYKISATKQNITYTRDLSSEVEFIGTGYIDNNGSIVNVPTAKTLYSNYIDISGFENSEIIIKVIQLTSIASQCIAFYDENKELITSHYRPIGNECSVDIIFKIPQKTVYFRTTYWNDDYASIYGLFTCYIKGVSTSDIFSKSRNKNQEVINLELENNITNIKKLFNVEKKNITVNFISKGYIQPDGEVMESGTVMDYSDYVYCKGIAKLFISTAVLTTQPSQGLAFYDDNKQFIVYFPREIGDENGKIIKEYIVPSNAMYFRTSYWNTENQILYGNFECYVLVDSILTDNVFDNQYGKYQGQINKDIYDFFVKRLDYREICDYFYINNSGVAIESDVYGCSSLIYCENGDSIKITMPVVLAQDELPYLVFYDSNGNIVSSIPANVSSVRGVELLHINIPDKAVAFKTSFWNYEQAILLNVNFFAEFKTIFKYRNYQNQPIYFSVEVNQTVNNFWATENLISCPINNKSTTGVLLLPDNYSQIGKPCPIIMYCHGYSHGVWYNYWGKTENFFLQKKKWASMGFAVFDCNGARNNNKVGGFTGAGSMQFVSAYKKCYDYIKENYNVEDRIFVIGGSAGGPTGINFCYMYSSIVNKCALLSPWVDIKTESWDQGFRDPFVEYLGFDNKENYDDEKALGYNPSKRIINVGDKYICYFPVPIKAWTENDMYINSILYRFIKAIRDNGHISSLRYIEGLTHTDVVSGNVDTVDIEVASWFLL